jgi:hypothetical protein
VLTVNLIPSITTFFEVILIGAGIDEGIGDWTGHPTGVCAVCLEILFVDSGTTSSDSAVEGPGMEMSFV